MSVSKRTVGEGKCNQEKENEKGNSDWLVLLDEKLPGVGAPGEPV